MTRFRRNVECERARAWAALAPDGELSSFEESSLGAHLGVCAGCRRFAGQVASLARTLAGEELVRPSHPVSIRIPSRRRSALAHGRSVAAAAAVALMALGVATRAPLPVDERTDPLGTTVAVTGSAEAEMRSLRERQHLLGSAADVLAGPPGAVPAVVASPYPV